MHTVQDQTLLLWIILLPLVGAVVNGLFGRRLSKRVVGAIGVGTVAVSFALALLCFIKLFGLRGDHENPMLVFHFYEWFSLTLPGGHDVPVNVRFMMDSLSSVMTLVVTGVGGLIHLYSVGYMGEDKGYARFFSYLNLFTASMLILVLASSVPLMFVGWEGVGLCSYLLIGFWFENRSYAAAGRKAFVANRIGDFGVLLGMFVMVMIAGSFEFTDINAAAEAGGFAPDFVFTPFGAMSVATVTCLFLFLGCTGKSAQIPLFVWLPDAMAGPTPVSALIHAATMVTAGVYLCCRLSPLFIESETAMAVIAVTGTATALLAATIAVVQNEMKKILAYSTVSQLGFMFAAVGVGFFAAGFFHVFTHAFFKACLFLGAGSVMHAVHAHGDADIRKLGGLRKIMPITGLTFLVSCLAISGVPPFSGFFSKDEILLGAALQALGHGSTLATSVGWFTLIGLTLAAVMTAFYMFRLYFLTFTGSYRSAEGGDEHAYDAHPHESPASMAFPLVVLGTGAVVVGFLGLPHLVPFVGTHLPNWWAGWMEASVASTGNHDSMAAVNLAAVLGLSAMALGVGAAWVLYRDKEHDAFGEKLWRPLHSFLFDKWRVDELYAATIINPIKKLAVVTGRVDQTFVDGLLTRVPSFTVKTFGRLFSRMQVGIVQVYGMMIVVGMAAIVWWFAYPHPTVNASLKGTTVYLSVAPGPGYEYRWDGDSDGEYEQGWSTRSGFTRRYTPGEPMTAIVEVRNAFGNTARKIVRIKR